MVTGLPQQPPRGRRNRGQRLSEITTNAVPAPQVAARAAIAQASQATGVDFNYLLAQAKLESGLDPNARAGNSSASGLYQFLGSTWLDTLKKHGAEHGLGWAGNAATDPALRAQVMALRHDPQASAMMAAELAGGEEAAPAPLPASARLWPELPELPVLEAAAAAAAGPSPEPPVGVEEAAEAACIHETITQKFPQGYNTVVGERGLRLRWAGRQEGGRLAGRARARACVRAFACESAMPSPHHTRDAAAARSSAWRCAAL